MQGCLQSQALGGVRSTGAGIKCLYCGAGIALDKFITYFLKRPYLITIVWKKSGLSNIAVHVYDHSQWKRTPHLMAVSNFSLFSGMVEALDTIIFYMCPRKTSKTFLCAFISLKLKHRLGSRYTWNNQAILRRYNR